MWEKVKIGSISKQIRGVSYSPKNILTNLSESGCKILRANNIQDGVIRDLSDVVFIEQSCINESQILIDGDIIICASSGSKHLVGKAAPFVSIIGEYSFGAFCKVLRPFNNVSKRYFHFFFQSPEYRKVISSLSEGANINNIRNEHIDNLEIPLPPLHIQEKIAKILDKADELRRKDQELQAKYDQLAQAIFIDMFGDPVKNEKGWEVRKLEEIVNFKTGPFGSLLHKEDYIEYGIPLINPINIVDNEIIIDNKFSITEEKYSDLLAYSTKENDILIGRRGQMGRCGIVKKFMLPLLCGTGCFIIRNNQKNVTSQYLHKVLVSKSAKEYLEHEAIGVTMKNLNTKILKNLTIAIPPIPLQEEFAKKIEIINQLKAQTNAEKSEELFQSLLQKAFKGELVS